MTGLAAVVAAMVVMSTGSPFSVIVLTGLGLLALAGALFPWTRRIPLLPVLPALPGAWLIGRSGLPGSAWVIPVVIVVIAFGGPIVAWFDENESASPISTLLFAISAAGVWATVPDTEEALVLLGAMAIPTILAWPLRVAHLGFMGGYSLLGLYMWVVAWGGRGREGSIVGATTALGLLLVAPIGSWMARKHRVTTTGWVGIWLVVLHLLVVVAMTRVAGLQSDLTAATAIALPTLVIALLVWVTVERSIGHAPRSETTE